MKKNKIMFILVLMILTIVSYIPRVDAAVKIINEDVYTLESIQPSCGPSYESVFPTYNPGKPFTILFVDENEKYGYYYWKGNNDCVLLNKQEELDFFTAKYYSYKYDESDNKLYKYGTVGYLSFAYRLTSDEVALEGKTYYGLTYGNNYRPLDYIGPGDDVSSYYEFVYLRRPDSVIIDPDVDYYTNVNGLLTLVENPDPDKIWDYYIIYEDYVTKEKVDTDIFSKNEVADHINNYMEALPNTTLTGNSIVKIGDKLFLQIWYRLNDQVNTTILEYFDENYESVPEFKNMIFENVGNFVVGNEYRTYAYNIYDKNHNLIFTLNEENETKYFNGYEYKDSLLVYLDIDEYYLLTKYVVIDGNNQTYNDKDIAIHFNGMLDMLSSVKVNDVVLDENNYTKENGSTIITLKKDYLETLDEGTYTVKVEYTDGGYANASFIIPSDIPVTENPETLDMIINIALVMIISIIGAFVTYKAYIKNSIY